MNKDGECEATWVLKSIDKHRQPTQRPIIKLSFNPKWQTREAKTPRLQSNAGIAVLNWSEDEKTERRFFFILSVSSKSALMVKYQNRGKNVTQMNFLCSFDLTHRSSNLHHTYIVCIYMVCVMLHAYYLPSAAVSLSFGCSFWFITPLV